MLASVGKHFSDVSMLRRILFAMVHLHRLNIALDLAIDRKWQFPYSRAAQSLNWEFVWAWQWSICDWTSPDWNYPPASKRQTSYYCAHQWKSNVPAVHRKLLTRKDRPSPVVIYHDTMGSIPGIQYHKIMQFYSVFWIPHWFRHQFSTWKLGCASILSIITWKCIWHAATSQI